MLTEVVLEGDSSKVVSFLNKDTEETTMDWRAASIIKQIHLSDLVDNNNFTYNWARRAANKAADLLAHKARLLSEEQKGKKAMTDAVVGVLVTELFKNLKDQSNVFLEFQTQFNQMEKNLTPMQSFLIDVRKLKEHKDKETFKSSLAILREMIYAADDILLDCRIRADYRSDGTTMHCICSPHELLFRYKTGNRLKEINMQINQMEKNLHTYLVLMMSQKNNRDESNHNTRWTTHIYNQSETVGLSEDTKKIKRWILPQNKELQQVGIVGMGGLGKTTLTQKIFNDIEVETRFEKRIWVSVSQTFTVTQIMKSMLEQLNKADNDCNSEGMLLKKIREALKHKSYLIVMDDVWDTKDGFGWWEQISRDLPKEEEYNCSIIITTRNEEVAKSMGVVEGRIHWPKILDENDSWTLFCKLAFKSNKGICKNLELETVGKEIVGKCDGLPLAIKTIGGLLSTKTQSISKWENIRDEFHDKLVDNGNKDSVMTSLQLSYDELPAELKHCMLCFSIYPEDSEISAEQLVHWWVGEGFVSRNERKTATQKAFDCLSELYSRCLVEVVNHRGYDGRISDCKMHDMVRDLIIKMAKEEAFCSFGDKCVPQFNSESRHLGLTSKIKTQSLQRNSKLRALLLTKNCSFSFSPSTGLENVNSLRVLDLSQSKLVGDFGIDDLLRWIKSQSRLAYLNLRGVAWLKQVPKWIRNLRNLQILILADCNDLELLSPDITTLPKLTVLDIRNCPSLRSLPKGLENLSNLEELSGFKLAKRGEVGCRLRDLGSLSKLRVLRINICEEDDIQDDELEVLSGLVQLRILSIDTNDSQNEEIMKKVDQLVPHKFLEELYLRKYSRDVAPGWLTPSNLPKLQYLCIEHAGITLQSPAFSDNKEHHNGPKEIIKQKQHWNIQGLCLKHLPRLEMAWKTVQTIMPELEYVEVSRCYLLQNFPFDTATSGFWRKNEDHEEIKKETS